MPCSAWENGSFLFGKQNMCGIIGYTGSENAVPKITKGLEVLEYRGYDSVGLAAQTAENAPDRIFTIKCRGRITALEKMLDNAPISNSRTAIGHTRWATHGSPSDINAHPHCVGKVVIVHNGIIENYRELANALTADGVQLLSETDTEVAAALLDRCYKATASPEDAIRQAVARMVGSYAFAIMFADRAGEVYAVRMGSPLILAKGTDGYYLASDMTALLPFTRAYYPLEERRIACLTPTRAALLAEDGTQSIPTWKVTNMTSEAAQKGGYPHFMLKEMYEEPKAIIQSVSTRIVNGLPDFSSDNITPAFWQHVKNIQIVACGSAMHAGLVGVRMIEKLAGNPTVSCIASEYRYHPPIASEGTLVILISQSGETADTLAALRYAKSVGLPTLAIVNAVETTIAREAAYRIYTYAGPEIAVATTKGYCTQVSVLAMIAATLAYTNGKRPKHEIQQFVHSITQDAPDAMQCVFKKIEDLRHISARLALHEHVFYIGRGIDYAMAEEGALKLKEISYIHAEAYAAGELKHGTISLIEDGTPVIAISTDKSLADKIETGVREVKSRGAYVILLCREDLPYADSSADEIVRLPVKSEMACLFASLAAVQVLAYETAAQRGCDIDRPRNLAKSVTVE